MRCSYEKLRKQEPGLRTENTSHSKYTNKTKLNALVYEPIYS